MKKHSLCKKHGEHHFCGLVWQVGEEQYLVGGLFGHHTPWGTSGGTGREEGAAGGSWFAWQANETGLEKKNYCILKRVDHKSVPVDAGRPSFLHLATSEGLFESKDEYYHHDDRILDRQNIKKI